MNKLFQKRYKKPKNWNRKLYLIKGKTIYYRIIQTQLPKKNQISAKNSKNN